MANRNIAVQLFSILLIGIPSLIGGCDMNTNAESDDPTRQVERDGMVDWQIAARGVKNPNVLAAMRRVPRHRFVPAEFADYAYEDHPQPIGYGQTISQPYIVAFMTEKIAPQPGQKILEVGTGSGYQAAVLAEMGLKVYSIEIVEPLAMRAAEMLKQLGYDQVTVRAGDGYHGWPEEAPFDAIIVTAAPREIPKPLMDQLAIGGRMIIPVGSFFQELILVHRTEHGYRQTRVLPVAFVPMTGEAEKGTSKSEKQD